MGGKQKPERSILNAEVLFHAGYKGREEPRAVVFGGRRHEITQILDRTRMRDRDSHTTQESFLCRLDSGSKIRIRVSENQGWEIEHIE